MRHILSKQATLILLLLTCISLQAGAAQEPAAGDPAATASQVAPAPVTEYTLPPDKLAKAQTLYTSRLRLLIVGTLWNFLLLAAFLAYVTYLALKITVSSHSRLSPVMRVPFSYVYASAAAGFALMLVHQVAGLARAWSRPAAGREIAGR